MIREKDIRESLILLVEDEVISIETILLYFKKKGYFNIIHAQNGVEGLKIFKEKSPVIVLTDIMMPEMDGLTMAEEIKKINPHTPIIITSAFSEGRYLLRAIEIGVDGFLVKPIKHKEMLDLINKLIRLKLLEKENLREKMLESIGLLSSGFAHDFNNLLTPILGNISLAKSHISMDDKIYKLLENAEASAEQAKELMKKFMTFSKGFELYKTNVKIDEVIKDSLQHNVCPNVKYHLDIKDRYTVEIDSGLIYECLTNIIKNACEAMPDGGDIYVNIETYTSNDLDNIALNKNEYIKITIRDTGKGMDNETLKKIFDPYFTTKKMDSNKGTGLGLSIAYSIVKAHKGVITVDSIINKGTTFNIYLPYNPQPTA